MIQDPVTGEVRQALSMEEAMNCPNVGQSEQYSNEGIQMVQDPMTGEIKYVSTLTGEEIPPEVMGYFPGQGS